MWHRNRPDPPTGGRKAREKAERDLEETRARWPEVRELAASLRTLRERNHFAEQIEYALRRRP